MWARRPAAVYIYIYVLINYEYIVKSWNDIVPIYTSMYVYCGRCTCIYIYGSERQWTRKDGIYYQLSSKLIKIMHYFTIQNLIRGTENYCRK
jgi:hypothetical protein